MILRFIVRTVKLAFLAFVLTMLFIFSLFMYVAIAR